MATVAWDHARQRELGAEDHAVQIDVDHPPRRLIALVDEPPNLHDPGVVHEHVDRAELALGLVQEAGERVAVGHVQRQGHSAPTELCGGPIRLLGIDVADRDPHALAQQRLRSGSPDPARSAGDGRRLSGEDARLFGHGSFPS
jgi:hypothetical protein